MYPDELFQFLAHQCSSHDLAWDCATGNGQAAVPLAKYFKQILATDASERQITNAVPHERVTYKVALSEESGMETSSVDLITVANGIHWFALDKFYEEANRILKPAGVIAAWTYSDLRINDRVDAVVQHLARVILRTYWPAESISVVEGYQDLPFPFEPIRYPQFKCLTRADFKALLGLFYSWSATQRYVAAHDKDPVDLVRKELSDVWGDEEEVLQITWNLALKVGQKKSHLR